MGKRVFDIFFSLTGLCLLLPFFVVIGLVIKLDSKGPVFYKQERVGRNGTLFKLVKFRTMKINADKLRAITVGNRDSRITSAGYHLRRLKIDELPQLWNVLLGEMSLVGPRPELKKFVDMYDAEQRQVISVRPGITDIASIEFRNENELLDGKDDPIQFYVREIMPRKLKLNVAYIRQQSILLDIRIIFRTIFSIFR